MGKIALTLLPPFEFEARLECEDDDEARLREDVEGGLVLSGGLCAAEVVGEGDMLVFAELTWVVVVVVVMGGREVLSVPKFGVGGTTRKEGMSTAGADVDETRVGEDIDCVDEEDGRGGIRGGMYVDAEGSGEGDDDDDTVCCCRNDHPGGGEIGGAYT